MKLWCNSGLGTEPIIPLSIGSMSIWASLIRFFTPNHGYCRRFAINWTRGCLSILIAFNLCRTNPTFHHPTKHPPACFFPAMFLPFPTSLHWIHCTSIKIRVATEAMSCLVGQRSMARDGSHVMDIGGGPVGSTTTIRRNWLRRKFEIDTNDYWSIPWFVSKMDLALYGAATNEDDDVFLRRRRALSHNSFLGCNWNRIQNISFLLDCRNSIQFNSIQLVWPYVYV
jgi:hypothetical protein